MLNKFIPNFITLLNLLSGCAAIVAVSKSHYELAFYFVCLGIFFDYLDGLFARLLNAYSELGLQLDSLADMVTSGVVPGFAVYMILSELSSNEYIPYIGFVISLGAAYRLAKFNISTNQSDEFIGLAVPANTLLVMGFVLLFKDIHLTYIDSMTFFIILSIFSAIIQNSPIKLFSLKIKKLDFSLYPFQMILIILSIIGIYFFNRKAIPFIILIYIILSLIKNFIYAQKTRKSQ